MEALPRAAHSAFLAEVDYALGRSPELLGAGSVSRVCREVQLRFIAGRDARSAAIDGRS
jgi:hypothetical protein